MDNEPHGNGRLYGADFSYGFYKIIRINFKHFHSQILNTVANYKVHFIPILLNLKF